MKWVLMVLVGGVAAWYFLVGSRYISEADVRAQYQNEVNWLDEGQHAKICAAFDDDYVGHVASEIPTGRVLEATDKAQSCAAIEAFVANIKKLNEKVGGGVVTNSDVTLEKVAISADRQTATVSVRSEVRVGTEKTLMMKLNSEATDTLIKRHGTVYRLRGEAKAPGP